MQQKRPARCRVCIYNPVSQREANQRTRVRPNLCTCAHLDQILRKPRHSYVSSLQRQIRSLQAQLPPGREPGEGRPIGSPSQERSLPEQQSTRQRASGRPTSQTTSADQTREDANVGRHDAYVGYGQPSTRAADSDPCAARSFSLHEEPTSSHPAGNSDRTRGISAMGATMVAQDHRGTPRSNEYYGASSLVSLIQGVAQPTPSGAFSNEFAPTKHQNEARGDSSIASLPMLCMLRPQYALPPRKIADDLLRLYFDNNHIFYPWTHSQSFRKRYESLWETGDSQAPDDSDVDVDVDVGLGGKNCPPNIFVCALNAMFALGCQFSDYPSADKDSASATFCERISGLLQFDLLDNGSLATVQALLLFGLYLQCTHYPERCWNIIGLAQRMAIGLGLQTATPSDDGPSLEIAVRRRVWHACVQMDMCVRDISRKSMCVLTA